MDEKKTCFDNAGMLWYCEDAEIEEPKNQGRNWKRQKFFCYSNDHQVRIRFSFFKNVTHKTWMLWMIFSF